MSETNDKTVQILNGWDSQGNQVADSDGVYPTVRGCGGAGYQQGYVFDHSDDKPTMVLNDQGGEQMSISYDVVSTLRSQMKHHEPIVFCNGGSGEEPIPINTMVGTRDTSEMRTTFGVGEPGDPQFTISAAHSHAVFVPPAENDTAYTIDEKMGQTYVWEEQANTLAQRDYKQPQAVYAAGFSYGQSDKASLGYAEEISPTIRGGEGGNERPCLVEVREAVPIENHPNDSRVKLSEDGVFQALTSRMGTGGNNTPLVMESKTVAFTQNQREEVRDLDDVATAIAAEPGMHQQTYIATCIGNGQADIASHITEEKAQTLSTMHDQLAIHVAYGVDAYNQEQYEEVSQTLREPIGGDNTAKVMTTYGLDRASYNQGQNAQFDFSVEEERAPTQTSRGPGAVAAIDFRNGSENYDVNGTMCSKETGYNNNTNQNVRVENTVRRLTPKECERLQSFPDFWTQIGEWTDSKGKVHKEADTPRYKALGNSIALPFWDWLLGRISAQYDRPATLGSLFSGIGGFDLCWERHNGKGTARWQSEIEEFPIAVCKKHFGDEDEGIEGDLDEYL
jgi:DNA (cytosine-5)-methyltransferase 1